MVNSLFPAWLAYNAQVNAIGEPLNNKVVPLILAAIFLLVLLYDILRGDNE